MSINMNGQTVIQLSTPLSSQPKNLVNVTYITNQMENSGSNALQGYPEAIANLQTQITSLETQTNSLVKLDGSSILSGNISCPAISGLETPLNTQLTNVANVAYVQNSMNQIVNQVNNNSTAITNAEKTLNNLTTESENLVKLDGSSILSGNISCPAISGLETPLNTQLTNVATVDFVNKSFEAVNNNFLSEVPCFSYAKGTLVQTGASSYLFSFDVTNLAYKSSNVNTFIEVNGQNIVFHQQGIYYIFVSLGKVTTNAPQLMSIQLLYLIQGAQVILNSINSINSNSAYSLASYIVIQNENIVTGNAPVAIQLFVSGGPSTSQTVTCSDMSWFIVALDLYSPNIR